MTARKKSGKKAAGGAKRLGVTKRTMKDLSATGRDVKGGFIMRDTVIIRTGH